MFSLNNEETKRNLNSVRRNLFGEIVADTEFKNLDHVDDEAWAARAREEEEWEEVVRKIEAETPLSDIDNNDWEIYAKEEEEEEWDAIVRQVEDDDDSYNEMMDYIIDDFLQYQK
jgi:hypothetical protein